MDESRFEELIEALLNDIPDDVEPQSRIEQILLNCIDGTGDEGLLDPHSRIEAYLKALSVKMAGGGGGGGSMFKTSASGRIPEYDHGYAVTELVDLFTTSATGVID
jgi:hypothetical protein